MAGCLRPMSGETVNPDHPAATPSEDRPEPQFPTASTPMEHGQFVARPESRLSSANTLVEDETDDVSSWPVYTWNDGDSSASTLIQPEESSALLPPLPVSPTPSSTCRASSPAPPAPYHEHFTRQPAPPSTDSQIDGDDIVDVERDGNYPDVDRQHIYRIRVLRFLFWVVVIAMSIAFWLGVTLAVLVLLWVTREVWQGRL